MIKLTCKTCNTPFNAWPYEIKQGRRFCSKKCAYADREGNPIPHLFKNAKKIRKECQTCGKEFFNYANSKKQKKFCSKECYTKTMLGKRSPHLPTTFPKGEKSLKWNGGETISNDGYVMKFKPNHHSHGSKNCRYVLKHRLIMEQHLGRHLTNDELVHHVNGDKCDNRIENLEIVTRAEHCRLHKPRIKK